jgi:2-C-methyl-D-erythritol 2,4-cyclodiphosphate synthase
MHRNQTNLPKLRIGLGYDSHRLGEGGPLRIGGIDIPAAVHAIGHSDADVLLHSITDALLGAVCEADIGRLFPDDAEENEGRESREFVVAALQRVGKHQMQLVNLDCVILAERPKMAPHIDAMRERIAELLTIEVSQISIKAKTGEGVGEIGTGESIATRVVALLAGV